MITITYKTIGGDLKQPEQTIINIFNGKMFVRYNIPNKAKATVDKMKQDGKKGVLFSRGCLIQIFNGKTEQEILEIARQDIKNGLYIAETKTKQKLEIIDYEEKI